MGVRKEQHPHGVIQHSKGGKRFVPADKTPIRCMECNHLLAPDFAIEGACPHCNTEFTNEEWRDMAVEAQQVKSQGGWTRDVLERFEDEQTGNAAYVEPDGTTNEQNEVARNLSKWAIQEKRKRRRKRKLVKSLGGSAVNDILTNNPYK